MPVYKIADEFVHYCTKCRLNLNHRVTLVDQGAPKRLLCLTCKTERRYTVSSDPSASTKVKAAVRKTTPKINPEIEWLEKLSNSTREPIPYNINTAFVLNDRIKHPTFGMGLVVEKIHPDKIKVFFRTDIKILKCGVAQKS